ncbi:MAG: hypothetical protein UHZ01_06240, partial [Prevotella sp.]|nr:hypothetical protein [Prevotella sp.]
NHAGSHYQYLISEQSKQSGKSTYPAVLNINKDDKKIAIAGSAACNRYSEVEDNGSIARLLPADRYHHANAKASA